jgi:hypothetical protein
MIRDGKKSRSGIQDEHSVYYFLKLSISFFWFKILKFFDADPDPGFDIFLYLDPGWKNSDTG